MPVEHRGVIVHCSATPNGKDIGGVKTIDEWHKQRGWRKVGYHVVINPDGKTEMGRAFGEEGAHCRGKNDMIGICLIGTDKFTEKQLKALRWMLNKCQIDFGIRSNELYTHNQFANKICPGFSVNKLLAWYLLSSDALNDHLLKEPIAHR